MRIVTKSDKTLDKIEIYLTIEQARDFALRISDMAHNPNYKDDDILDDVISGDSNEDTFELNSIEIYRYNESSPGKFWDEKDGSVILFDK